MSFDKNKFLRQHIYLNWLRPENILYEFHSNLILLETLKKIPKKSSKINLGVGNGINSFLAQGGEFNQEFDWYVNNHLRNKKSRDIYNQFNSGLSKKIVKKKNTIKFDTVIDNKKNLLKLSKFLGISNEYFQKDLNKKIILNKKYNFIYSNMLYWLDDINLKIKEIKKFLEKDGYFLLGILNKNILKNSIVNEFNKKSKIYNYLNNGRYECYKQILDEEAFEKQLEKEFVVIEKRQILKKFTNKCWDIGLRPFSVELIKMANHLNKNKRFEIKKNWCGKLYPVINELFYQELD